MKSINLSLTLILLLALFNLSIAQVPTITNFYPKNAKVEAPVYIKGSNFTAGTNVYFGPVKASVSFAGFDSIVAIVPNGANYSQLRVLNTNGMAYSSYPFNAVFNQNQNMTPSLAGRFELATQNSTANVQVADFDGDGKPDLAVMNCASFTISIFRNISSSGSLSPGSFGPRMDIAVANWPRFVNTADFDNDGKLDLIVGHDYPVSGVYQLSIIKNTSTNGSITFQAPVLFPAATRPGYSAIGDIDGDGKSDFVITNWESRIISVYRNTTSTGIINSSSFAPRIEINDSSSGPLTYPSQIALADLNGDNKCDIIFNNCATNNIRIYKNISTLGTPNFDILYRVTLNTGNNGRGLAIGDLDSDGKLDIALANYGTNTFSIFKNSSSNNNISFAQRVDITTGFYPFGLNIGDINGDGKPDIVTANQGLPTTLSIFKNVSQQGVLTNESFASPINYPAGNEPRDLVICDLDADTRPEVLVANYNNESQSTVSIFKNTTIISNVNTISIEVPASFKLRQNYPNPFNPETSIIFDLPKPDFVTLEVYNSQGVLVQTLVNSNLSAGTYQTTFSGADVSSGIYFYKVITSGFTETKKMMLIK
ncbi:MAG: FG-GAP-like repeat-containing protein [Ignavibacteria bacterium]|nr:FG-GAP-like repeat-containing protein [Ignavibacteria bacterium]